MNVIQRILTRTFLSIALGLGLLPALHAQGLAPAIKSSAKPEPPVKLAQKDMRALPFSREFKETIFKATDRDVGDELRVTFAAGVHISGKKRGDTVRFNGRPVGHVGKIVLMPVGARAGKLVVRVPSAEEVTYYFAALETGAATLNAKPMTLAVGKTYVWSLKMEAGQTTLLVLDGAVEVIKLTGAEADVKGFGFAATVRNKGNEADLQVAFD